MKPEAETKKKPKLEENKETKANDHENEKPAHTSGFLSFSDLSEKRKREEKAKRFAKLTVGGRERVSHLQESSPSEDYELFSSSERKIDMAGTSDTHCQDPLYLFVDMDESAILGRNVSVHNGLYSEGFASCIAVVIVSPGHIFLEHTSDHESLVDIVEDAVKNCENKGENKVNMEVTFAVDSKGYKKDADEALRHKKDPNISDEDYLKSLGLNPERDNEERKEKLTNAINTLQVKGINVSTKVLDLPNGKIIVRKDGVIDCCVNQASEIMCSKPVPISDDCESIFPR